MTKEEFQKNVLHEIKRELEKGDVPLERMRELAGAALEIGQRYPADIPDEEALEIVHRFSEITGATAGELKKEMKDGDQSEIDEIRRTMGLR
ncbi:MAG: hypothetical protein RL272_38 [Candidatus Parcubacteria bacterium]|jgi:hypothetical protein